MYIYIYTYTYIYIHLYIYARIIWIDKTSLLTFQGLLGMNCPNQHDSATAFFQSNTAPPIQDGFLDGASHLSGL